MKISILIVTHQKHFHWLKWCLRSIEKYATGFQEVVVSIPEDTDWKACRDLSTGYRGVVPLRLDCYEDWPEKGFIRHMDRVCHADRICTDADFIFHMDSDCFFIEPVTPSDYFNGPLPILAFARYEWCCKEFFSPYFMNWKAAVEAALGGVSEFERMRRHGAVHYRELYGMMRRLVRENVGCDFEQFIRQQKNEYPQSFCEFGTFGEVAWRHFRSGYHWINQETDPWPHDKMVQAWSWGDMDKVQNIWLNGSRHELIPNELFKLYLT